MVQLQQVPEQSLLIKMKATELRIGNLVDLGNRIAKVIDIGHLSCTVVDLEETQDTLESYERTEGIPLTEEWIEKFGFNKKGESRYGFKYNYPMADWGFTIETSFDEGKWFFGHEFYDSGDDNLDYQTLNFCFNLQYVHTLQNIFHSLTGEELKIK